MTPSLAQAPYAVELLFPAPPAARAAELLAALETRLGGVTLGAGGGVDLRAADGGPLLFALGGLAGGGAVPQLAFAPSPAPVRPERFAEALARARGSWEDAELALGAARASAFLTDFLAGELDRRVRLAAFLAATATFCELLPVLAVYWSPADKLVDPRAVVAAEEDPLAVAVEVRARRVEGGLPGEVCVDTLGLAALGVADLQCRFVGLEPAAVARRVRALARTAWGKGALDASVTGLRQEAWAVRAGAAALEPERPVQELEPPPPFGARGPSA